jgi:hypothetical protein
MCRNTSRTWRTSTRKWCPSASTWILIVRAGKTAEPLLQDALHRRENLPLTLSLLADLGDRMVEKEIQPFSSDQDPNVAEAARQALRVLASNR